MNNQFNITSYFSSRYGLPPKPTVSKPTFKISRKQIFPIFFALVLIVIGFSSDLTPLTLIGIGVIALVAAFGIAMPIARDNTRISNEKKAVTDWENNYNIRRTTWDSEFDKHYYKKLSEMKIYESAISKLGLNIDPSIERKTDSWREATEQAKNYPQIPFSIHDNKYDNAYRQGSDGKWRSSSHEITWIFFGKDQVYLYTVKFDILNSKKIENTLEFFYEDIVSVSITTNSVEINKALSNNEKVSIIETEQFVLTVPGDKINLAFTSDSEINEQIQAMKSTIREKKKSK